MGRFCAILFCACVYWLWFELLPLDLWNGYPSRCSMRGGRVNRRSVKGHGGVNSVSCEDQKACASFGRPAGTSIDSNSTLFLSPHCFYIDVLVLATEKLNIEVWE